MRGGGRFLEFSILRRIIRNVYRISILGLLFSAVVGAVPNPAPSEPPLERSAQNGGGHDDIDRSDPNFVTASLLIMSPGDRLYSCAGHACIRLECPVFDLDYCFSYEGEGVTEKILTFFMGKLKMGMFAVPTEEYLRLGRESGRGVVQYTLNLPPDAKQRLWRYLDNEVAKGADLPYDYLRRGCAHAVLLALRAALGEGALQTPPWPEKYQMTRREIVDDAIRHTHPWNRFFLHAICGAELDRDVPNMEKVILPGDLLDLLRGATIYGKPVVVGEWTELLVADPEKEASTPTPLVVAALALVLAVANFSQRSSWLDMGFLVFQTLLGVFFTYLVFFSSLPATGWNWLLIPFNPLPAIFWKWRRKWAFGFALALVLWECGILFAPHRLTDPAYLTLVAALILMYVRIGRPWRVLRHGLARVGFGSGRGASTMRPSAM